MKRFLMALALVLVSFSGAYAQSTVIGGNNGVNTDSNCNQAKYYKIGTLCQDTDDGKLYKGTGAAVEELSSATAGAGDVTGPAASSAGEVPVYSDTTGKILTRSNTLTGFPYLTAGVLSANNASTTRTNLGLTIGTNVLAPDGSAANLTNFPTFNQNTTGSAASVKSPATTGVTQFTGPAAGTTRVMTVPDANSTLLVSGGALGTPSSGTLTSATGLPIATGVSGLGTGVATALAVNVGSAGAPVVLNGALGTPSGGTLTNATGLPIATGVSGLGTGIATALAVNTGSAGAPVLYNGALGTPSSGTLTNASGYPFSAVVAAFGSGECSGYLKSDGTCDTPASGGFADPNINAISMWDDTDGTFVAGVIGSGLSWDHASHTMSVTSAGDAAADGATKGVAAFTAADFNASSGVISIDYTNGQAAATGTKGFLTGTDWDTFNGKQNSIIRPVSGPTSATDSHVALFDTNSQTLKDGGALFSPAAPGAIGGTTPAAGTFTKVDVTASTAATTGLSKDGSNNLVFTDAVTGSKTLAEIANQTAPSNLALSAGTFPGTTDGETLVALPLGFTTSGAAPTVDTAGDTAIDTTSDQFVYYGGAKRVLPHVQFQSFVIPAPADTDDINIMKAPYGMTITAINCIVQGTTNVVGQLQECTSAGASCTDLDSDITCDADGAADDGTISDPTIASGAWLRWKTTSVSGTPTFLTVTFTYEVISD